MKHSGEGATSAFVFGANLHHDEPTNQELQLMKQIVLVRNKGFLSSSNYQLHNWTLALVQSNYQLYSEQWNPGVSPLKLSVVQFIPGVSQVKLSVVQLSPGTTVQLIVHSNSKSCETNMLDFIKNLKMDLMESPKYSSVRLKCACKVAKFIVIPYPAQELAASLVNLIKIAFSKYTLNSVKRTQRVSWYSGIYSKLKRISSPSGLEQWKI